MNDKPKVLIVDDNPDDVFLARYHLQASEQFESVCDVSDGSLALEWFLNPETTAKEHPDCYPPKLVLLDINMPLMNGFEFLEQLSRMDGTKPFVVVMLTSSDSELEKERARQFEMVKGFATKPITPEYIEQLVRTLN